MKELFKVYSCCRLVLLDFASEMTHQICQESDPGGVAGNISNCGVKGPRGMAVMGGDVYFATSNAAGKYAIMKMTGEYLNSFPSQFGVLIPSTHNS